MENDFCLLLIEIIYIPVTSNLINYYQITIPFAFYAEDSLFIVNEIGKKGANQWFN